MKTHIIYLPGLGQNYDTFRAVSLKLWRFLGVETSFLPMDWTDKKGIDDKYQRLHALIKTIPMNRRLVLIGESAGAVVALKAATSPRVTLVATLCGVAQASAPIAVSIRRKSPALYQGVKRLQAGTTSAPCISFRALYDPVVKPRFSKATGARVYVLPMVGHLATILLALTAFAPYIVWRLRQSPQ